MPPKIPWPFVQSRSHSSAMKKEGKKKERKLPLTMSPKNGSPPQMGESSNPGNGGKNFIDINW